MRNLFNILAIAFMAVFCLSSCSETNDEVEEFPDWKNRNEAFFASKYNTARQAVASGSDAWKVIKCYARDPEKEGTSTDYIVVKVLREGTGSGYPLFTDSVRVHYRGQLLSSATHMDSKDSELGMVFDKSWSTDEYNEQISIPSKFAVSGVVDGFSTALQHMHIGDRWLVYVPYQLGYGTSVNGSIPAYSTLVFDIALVAYYRAGTLVPNWQGNVNLLWEE